MWAEGVFRTDFEQIFTTECFHVKEYFHLTRFYLCKKCSTGFLICCNMNRKRPQASFWGGKKFDFKQIFREKSVRSILFSWALGFKLFWNKCFISLLDSWVDLTYKLCLTTIITQVHLMKDSLLAHTRSTVWDWIRGTNPTQTCCLRLKNVITVWHTPTQLSDVMLQRIAL